jgi:site-specific DNA-methyltransferase (adenine-specific)
MTPRWSLLPGDCIAVLKTLPDNSIDAIITDPPYGLEFMGSEWDAPWKQDGWQTGGGFSKPGNMGGRIPLPSFSATSRTGAANLTCGICGKRARGKDKCQCAEPWYKPIGKRLNPENEGLPSDVTSLGMNTQLKAFQAWCEVWARELLRVIKPGGHILAFGGTRMYHRMTCALEDAGWEVRDCLATWLYGSGFPKSKNVSLAIDKGEGHPDRGRAIPTASTHLPSGKYAEETLTSNPVPPYEAKTEDAKKWEGWGTALKPSHEPVVIARKPLRGTVAENVLTYGTGAMNIDACRVATAGETFTVPLADPANRTGVVGRDLGITGSSKDAMQAAQKASIERLQDMGRWPPNTLFVHHPQCKKVGTRQVAGPATYAAGTQTGGYGGSVGTPVGQPSIHYADPETGTETVDLWECVDGCPVKTLDEQAKDDGGVSRFFPGFSYTVDDDPFLYCPKANTAEREAGCENLPSTFTATMGDGIGEREHNPENPSAWRGNFHPTVKPISLMRWLIKLVTPPGGTVLDPFTGSGTTGCAAMYEDCVFVGIEREPGYVQIARTRIEHHELKSRGGVSSPWTSPVKTEEKPAAPTSLEDLFGF